MFKNGTENQIMDGTGEGLELEIKADEESVNRLWEAIQERVRPQAIRFKKKTDEKVQIISFLSGLTYEQKVDLVRIGKSSKLEISTASPKPTVL